MDRFKNIETSKLITTVIFNSSNIAEVNMLRRSIYASVESYAIDYVVFDTNVSARHDEIIALRLGQCVIDNDKFVPPTDGTDFKAHIDVSGPGWFTTDDIKDITFAYETPITLLKEGQKIKCDVIVRKGTGENHVKWRPVSTFAFTEYQGEFKITMKGLGMMSPETILERGLEKMEQTAKLPVYTLFSQAQPVV